MKKECAVVQDLLVLYEDDVLKEESRQIVEEHIQRCEECMQIYENAGKELPVMEAVSESSKEEQEAAANQVMKRLVKMSRQRIIGTLLIVILIVMIVVTVGGNICDNVTETNWGLSGIYLMPTEDVSVEEIYVLKSGDIYCRLKSDRKVDRWQVMDWGTPDGNLVESTDDAVKELRFLEAAPWERKNMYAYDEVFIFTLERQGVSGENGEKIIQRCKEINVYGKTKKDKSTIWKKGQKVEEAPEEIEKEAVLKYIENGQAAKAIRECEMMGWDNYEEIFEGFYEDTVIGDDEGEVIFEQAGGSVM